MLDKVNKEIKFRVFNIVLVVFILLIGNYVRGLQQNKILMQEQVYNDYLVSQLQVIILDDVLFKVENYSPEVVNYSVEVINTCDEGENYSFTDVITGEEVKQYNLENECFTPVVSVNR